MAKRDKRPNPIVAKTKQGLSPVSAFFAEDIANDPVSTEYDLVRRTKRSNPHLALYWVALDKAVKATGMWPTPEHLHHELKLICGFTFNVVDWETGEVSRVVDSVAFDKMTQKEFSEYFEHAIPKLIEKIGFDPLEDK